MNGVGARQESRFDQGRNAQVGLVRQRLTDANRLIRLHHMTGIGVGCRIHGDRTVTLCTGAAHDAQGNLSSVGNQDFGEGGGCGHGRCVSGK